MNIVECFDERLAKAKCCALTLSSDYVAMANKGRNTDQMFNTLMLVDAYMNTLEKYCPTPTVSYKDYLFYLRLHNKEVYLHDTGKCVCIDPDLFNCLTTYDVEAIFDQISTLCGGCSCNCN